MLTSSGSTMLSGVVLVLNLSDRRSISIQNRVLVLILRRISVKHHWRVGNSIVNRKLILCAAHTLYSLDVTKSEVVEVNKIFLNE